MSTRTFGSPGLTTPRRLRPSDISTVQAQISSPLSSNSFVINNTVIDLPSTYLSTDFPELICEALSIDVSLLIGFQHNTCGYIPLNVALKHLDNLPHRGLTTVLKPSDAAPMASPARSAATPIVMHGLRSPYKSQMTSPVKEYVPDAVAIVPGINVPLPRVDMTRGTPSRKMASPLVSPYKPPANAIIPGSSAKRSLAWEDAVEEDEQDDDMNVTPTSYHNTSQARPGTALPRSRETFDEQVIGDYEEEEDAEVDADDYEMYDDDDDGTSSEQHTPHAVRAVFKSSNLHDVVSTNDGVIAILITPQHNNTADACRSIYNYRDFDQHTPTVECKGDSRDCAFIAACYSLSTEPHFASVLFLTTECDVAYNAGIEGFSIPENISEPLLLICVDGEPQEILTPNILPNFCDVNTISKYAHTRLENVLYSFVRRKLIAEGHDVESLYSGANEDDEEDDWNAYETGIPEAEDIISGADDIPNHHQQLPPQTNTKSDSEDGTTTGDDDLDEEYFKYLKDQDSTAEDKYNEVNVGGINDEDELTYDQQLLHDMIMTGMGEGDSEVANDVFSALLSALRNDGSVVRHDTIDTDDVQIEEEDDDETAASTDSPKSADLPKVMVSGVQPIFIPDDLAVKAVKKSSSDDDVVDTRALEDTILSSEPVEYDDDDTLIIVDTPSQIKEVPVPAPEPVVIEKVTNVVRLSPAGAEALVHLIERSDNARAALAVFPGLEHLVNDLLSCDIVEESNAERIARLRAERSDRKFGYLRELAEKEYQSQKSTTKAVEVLQLEKDIEPVVQVVDQTVTPKSDTKDDGAAVTDMVTEITEDITTTNDADEYEDDYETDINVDELVNYELLQEESPDSPATTDVPSAASNDATNTEEDEFDLPLTDSDREILDMLKNLSEQVQNKLQDVMSSQERVQLAHSCILDAAKHITDWDSLPTPRENPELDQQALVAVVTASANAVDGETPKLELEVIARAMRVVGTLMQANKDEVDELITSQAKIDEVYKQWEEDRALRRQELKSAAAAADALEAQAQAQPTTTEKSTTSVTTTAAATATAPETNKTTTDVPESEPVEEISTSDADDNGQLLRVIADLFSTIMNSLVESKLIEVDLCVAAFEALKQGNMDIITAVMSFIDATGSSESSDTYATALDQFVVAIKEAVAKN